MKYLILAGLLLSGCTNNMQSSQIVGINVISVKDCNETREVCR